MNDRELSQHWIDVAGDALEAAGLSDKVVTKYVRKLAEMFSDDVDAILLDVADDEQDREDAARDAHWQAKIDEARGK